MLQWHFKKYDSLTNDELYAILRIRQEIFVLEQNCVFIDADNKDQGCHHLWGMNEANELVAYARIVPPGHIYEEPSIGRIVSLLKYRKHGYGRELMKQAIIETEKLYGNVPIRIEAQLYLKRFYRSFGFVAEGEKYLLDGIEHIIMVRQPGT